MSSSANVLSVQALADLKAALKRFGSDVREPLNTVAQEIRHTLDWLAERQAYWHAEVRRRQEIVARARAALSACQSSGSYDPKTGRSSVPDCSAQQRTLLQAQTYLREAEAQLQNVQQWLRQVQQVIADYQRQAQRLTALLDNDLPKSEAFLERKLVDLERYRTDSSISTSGSRTIGPLQSGATISEAAVGVSWMEKRAILKRIDDGLLITTEELQKLRQPTSDLQAGTAEEDRGWVEQLLESERYREMARDSQEAQDILDAIQAALKAVDYWRSKP
jgi:DNA repair exonuclease SbcCD ATPase subunit